MSNIVGTVTFTHLRREPGKLVPGLNFCHSSLASDETSLKFFADSTVHDNRLNTRASPTTDRCGALWRATAQPRLRSIEGEYGVQCTAYVHRLLDQCK